MSVMSRKMLFAAGFGTTRPIGEVLAMTTPNTPYVKLYDVDGDVLTAWSNPSPDIATSGIPTDIIVHPSKTFFIARVYSSPYIATCKMNSDRTLTTLTGATGASSDTTSIALNPAGTQLAQCTNSGTVRVFSVSGTTISNPVSLTGLPSYTQYDVAFNHDGSKLAVTGGGITIYNVSGNTYTKIPNAITPVVYGSELIFSRDGSRLALLNQSSPFINVYSVTGDTFTKLPNPDILPPSVGKNLAFNHDGSKLVITHASAPYLTIYSINGNALTKIPNPATLPTGAANGVFFNSTGTKLAVAHTTTPFITVYNVFGDTFTKIANPTSLPGSTGGDVCFG